MTAEKITKIISEQFGIDEGEVLRDMSFADTLGADSLDVVELMMSIEENFDLPEIEDDDLKKIETVGDLIDYVEKAVGE